MRRPKRQAATNSDRVVFVHSDPALISFFLRFLDRAGIEPDRVTYRVHIHESADVRAAERFWEGVRAGSAAQFRKSSLKRHNPKTVRKKVGDDYHGCLRIEVTRSAELYQKVEGWAHAAMRPHKPDDLVTN